jgi:hypothetical protein
MAGRVLHLVANRNPVTVDGYSMIPWNSHEESAFSGYQAGEVKTCDTFFYVQHNKMEILGCILEKFLHLMNKKRVMCFSCLLQAEKSC